MIIKIITHESYSGYIIWSFSWNCNTVKTLDKIRHNRDSRTEHIIIIKQECQWMVN
jgi:hypothetical protein